MELFKDSRSVCTLCVLIVESRVFRTVRFVTSRFFVPSFMHWRNLIKFLLIPSCCVLPSLDVQRLKSPGELLGGGDDTEIEEDAFSCLEAGDKQ